MKSSLIGVGEQIKGKSTFTQLYGTVWMGGLASISEKEMYQVKVKADHSMVLSGALANPDVTPIAITNGVNWIGYVPSFPAPVGYALAGMNAQNTDVIKNDAGFATFYNGTWYSTSLLNMQPGCGYQYNSTSTTPTTFYYPSVAAKSLITEYQPPFALRTAHKKGRYANNMTVTAIVVKNNEELLSDAIEIEAFCGNECRGSVLLHYEEAFDRYLGYLMIHGESDEMITLKVYDHETGMEYAAVNQPFPFIQDEIKGNLLKPFVVDLGKEITGIGETPEGAISLYPNPAHDQLYITHPWTSIETLEIVDIYGRIITRETNFSNPFINIKDMSCGVYMLRITNNGNVVTVKFVKN
jgi:hypothetical protein